MRHGAPKFRPALPGFAMFQKTRMATSVAAFRGTRAGALTIFVGRRILWMIPVVFFVIVITFALLHLAPGSPWDRTGGRQLAPSVVHNLDVKHGLDKPPVYQVGLYVWNVVHFGMGVAYHYKGKSVTALLDEGWRDTATLAPIACR